jgi:hypothetical protein
MLCFVSIRPGICSGLRRTRTANAADDRALDIVVEVPSKTGWDRIAVPGALAREQVDVVFGAQRGSRAIALVWL